MTQREEGRHPGKGSYTAVFTQAEDGTWNVQVEGHENEIHVSASCIEEGRRAIRDALALRYKDAKSAEITAIISGTDGPAIQDEAFNALRLKAVGATCYLVEPSESVFDLSSGTLICTPTGTLVVLTAAHCLEDFSKHADEVQVGLPFAGEPWKGIIDTWHAHPTVDAGLVVLKHCPDVLHSQSLAYDRVGPRPDDDCSDSVLLVGSPTSGVAINPPELGVNTQQYVCPFSDLRAAKHDRWKLEWVEGELITTAPYSGAPRDWQERARAFETRMRGQRIPLLKPHGMSGGGLWQIQRDSDHLSDVWHAGQHLRLVGIQSTYLEPDVFIEPVSRWVDWFRETVRRLDAR